MARLDVERDGAMVRLLVGLDEDWGWWVSPDHVQLYYSSVSVYDAVDVWLANDREGKNTNASA